MGDAGLEEDEATTHECWRGCKKPREIPRFARNDGRILRFAKY